MNAARIAAVTAALLMPVSLAPLAVAGAQDDARTVTSSAASLKGATKAKKVSVKLLPGIAQPGTKAASPGSAKVVLEVAVQPKRRTVVTLQTKVGRKWKKVSSASTTKKGTHVFRAPARRKNKPATYRVVVGKRKSTAVSTQRWLKASFADTFSGTTLGNAWTHRAPHNLATNRTCSRGDARATKVSGGTVRLSVYKDPERNDLCTALRDGTSTGKYAYRINGHIGTEESYSFTYGIAAVRAKFPKLSGQHAGFWLQVLRPDLSVLDPRVNGTEIDVIESYGIDSGKEARSLGLTTGIHRYVGEPGNLTMQPDGGWVRNAKQYLNGKKDSFHGGYHVFSVEWTPQHYIYRIDGKEYWRTTKGISGTPQFPVLSNLSSDYELERLKGDAKSLPQHMHVDWIQVWETQH